MLWRWRLAAAQGTNFLLSFDMPNDLFANIGGEQESVKRHP
jgi:hypothetical protein